MKILATISLVLLQWCWCSVSWAADAARPAVSKPTAASMAAATVQPAPESAKVNDQLVLDPTLVTGNRELPKVMYIVPWKKADLGNLPGQPFNTLLDEALTPIDREVFQREVKYYQVIAEKDQPGAQTRNQQATPTTDKK